MSSLKIVVSMMLTAFCLCSVRAQQDHVNIDWAPQKNTENLVPLSANIISPEVHDDHTVIFRLRAPQATDVRLTGNVLGRLTRERSLPLVKDADGVWSLTIGPLAPNIYLYHFLIDGVNTADPNNTYAGFANMPPFSMVWVHGDGPAFYDARPVPHGDLVTHFYHSPVTNGERYLLVYTPPGYDPTKAYPVLYRMGGSGDLPETWTMHGQVNFILDNLLAEGKITPMLVVIPNNQLVHRMNPRHTELSFPLTEREFIEAILPYVESRYKVIDSPHARAISGLSMGGRHAQYVGLRHLNKFGSIGLLSAALPLADTPVLHTPKAVNDSLDYFFVGAGPFETFPRARHEVLHQQLDSLGVRHEYYVGGPGAHDLQTWRHLLYERFLPNLFKGVKQ
jgi:enterochelin esterase family protein